MGYELGSIDSTRKNLFTINNPVKMNRGDPMALGLQLVKPVDCVRPGLHGKYLLGCGKLFLTIT